MYITKDMIIKKNEKDINKNYPIFSEEKIVE
jgi:hypothetical protein